MCRYTLSGYCVVIVRIDSLICICYADSVMMVFDDYPLMNGVYKLYYINIDDDDDGCHY